MEPVVFDVAKGITAIDTFYAGRERYTAAYLVRGSAPAIVETGPATSFAPVVAGLERLGIGTRDLAHIAVTHIHLDHAGGVWRIAERFPNATVWVHERGARHLADPSRLRASVESIYGKETMASLFGTLEPVAAQRIRTLDDGATIDLGGRSLRAVYTPGHAKHHMAIADSASGAVFTGDALGIHPPISGGLRPATPPPDYDLELAIASIERIRDHARGSAVLFSHFGPVSEVDRICDIAVERFRRWTEAVGEAVEDPDDLDAVVRVLKERSREDAAADTGAEAELDVQALETMSSIRLNAMGIAGYWKRRREAGQPS